MKIGASYNIFDGTELLGKSIESIRSSVDYVSVVYQNTSNFGKRSTVDILQLLREFVQNKMVDEIREYVPVGTVGHGNEIAKRQIGLDMCRSVGCTHFISMDCDEFYKKEQFDAAASIVVKGGYDSSACMMQTYYKEPTFALEPPETYFVPFIYKIDERSFKMSTKWPVIADPTRKMEPKKFLAFERSQLEMHHYSYVRSDIRAKLHNSSASGNFRNRIEEIAKYHDDWSSDKPAMLAGKEKRLYNVVKTQNYFNITI